MAHSNGVSVGLNDLYSLTEAGRIEDEANDANAMQQTQEINTQEVRDECTVAQPKLPANTRSGTVATADFYSQNELTQLAESEELQCTPPPPQPPVNPRTIPWGRLIPCSRNNVVGSSSNPEALNGGGIDLLPRDPPLSGKTRSRSPSSPSAHGYTYLGISGLNSGDSFNQYDIGRSKKCDIMAIQPPDLHEEKKEETGETTETKHDWVHSMVSNRHCRLYCILQAENGQRIRGSSSFAVANDLGVKMEVYVEDTSGNGTLINGTTLLRRQEKRLLHTGDEICLINPGTLRRKVRDPQEQQDLIRQYSFIFVNVHQQQGHQNTAFSLVASLRSAHNIKSRGLVDPRFTNSHSHDRRSRGGGSADNYVKNGKEVSSWVPTGESKGEANQMQPPLPRQSRRLSESSGKHRRIEEFYDFRDLLGSGTCGEVRRAIDRQTGEERAVKIIKTGGMNLSHSRRLLETDKTIMAEASILQSLDHPHIVRLIDVFIAPDKALYLVMEMMDGGDLFDRIVDKGKYSEVESRQIMRRILSAVYYLHEEKNVCHRDLKPENIMCVSRSSDICVKLTDFGLAKGVTDEGLKTFCGTPQYFAPEVLKRRHTHAGRGRYGKEADMWSLGVILYILLCGVPPFDVSASIDIVAEANIQFKGKKWQQISDEAKDLVKRLLLTDPKMRLSVKGACEHEWILTEDGDTHCNPLMDPVVTIAGSNERESNPTNDQYSKSAQTVKSSQKTDFPLSKPKTPTRRLLFHEEFIKYDEDLHRIAPGTASPKGKREGRSEVASAVSPSNNNDVPVQESAKSPSGSPRISLEKPGSILSDPKTCQQEQVAPEQSCIDQKKPKALTSPRPKELSPETEIIACNQPSISPGSSSLRDIQTKLGHTGAGRASSPGISEPSNEGRTSIGMQSRSAQDMERETRHTELSDDEIQSCFSDDDDESISSYKSIIEETPLKSEQISPVSVSASEREEDHVEPSVSSHSCKRPKKIQRTLSGKRATTETKVNDSCDDSSEKHLGRGKSFLALEKDVSSEGLPSKSKQLKLSTWFVKR
eukprot:scaffold172237_cov52-Attheya_sp.AAC.2